MDELDNTITEITRRAIFDELRLGNVDWAGRLSEPDFLSRVFDLTRLRSNDHRYRNMAQDVVQHRVNNSDWEADWVFDDSRLNLLRGPDEVLLRFLCEVVHPIVRADEDEAHELVAMFNRHLTADGFEIAPKMQISGRTLYAARQRSTAPVPVTADARRIADDLSSDHIIAQITRMETSIASDPALAIGSAKEFVETICKGILSAKGKVLTGGETLPQLVKRTRDVLELYPSGEGRLALECPAGDVAT